jgi:hypothetical protein
MVQNIEFYVKLKVRSTAIPLEAKNTLSSMCKESKRHKKCIPSTSNTFINYVFYFLKVHVFLWRSVSFLSGP